MSGGDAELSELRAGVSCALLLERDGYSLDKADSTRRCLKYRRGAGEVLIVNHEGQGWWDPMSQAKGDVFTLAQHLEPGLNFGQVRKLLRGMVGMAPSYPAAKRLRELEEPIVPPGERWAGRRRLALSAPTLHSPDQECVLCPEIDPTRAPSQPELYDRSWPKPDCPPWTSDTSERTFPEGALVAAATPCAQTHAVVIERRTNPDHLP